MGVRAETALREIVAVRDGQTVSDLCTQYYGVSNPTLMDILLDFNPEIENAHLIRSNQRIRMPKITEEVMLLRASDQSWQVHLGTYWNEESSRRLISLPALQGKTVKIVPRKVSPEDTWYRVIVVGMTSRDEAKNLVSFLKERRVFPLAIRSAKPNISSDGRGR